MANPSVPENLIESPDRRMIYAIFLIGLVCSIGILNPFHYMTGFLNSTLLRAIPLPVGMMSLSLPIIVYYTLNVMERYFFVELQKKEIRRDEFKKIQQKLTFMARYRSKGRNTSWEITNRSSFRWTNAKFFIERSNDGEIITEKHQLGNIAAMKRFTIASKLDPIAGSQWRVMILAEEGNSIDYPERQASLEFEV